MSSSVLFWYLHVCEHTHKCTDQKSNNLFKNEYTDCLREHTASDGAAVSHCHFTPAAMQGGFLSPTRNPGVMCFRHITYDMIGQELLNPSSGTYIRYAASH